MAEMQVYGHNEIQRYLQQKMSQQEMHEFEKALMNDPFLADALEGFSTVDAGVSARHLDEIEKALTVDKQSAKVVPISAKKSGWWKAVAVVFIIISAGVITWSVVKNDSEILAVANPAKTVTDSIGPTEKPLARVELLPVEQEGVVKRKPSPIVSNDVNRELAYQKSAGGLGTARPEIAEDEAVEKMGSAASPTTDAWAVTVNQANETSQTEFKGKVVDKAGEPLPLASVKANNGSIATVSDGNGNFSLKAPDSVLEVIIKSPGYATATAQIKGNRADNRIALREADPSLAEIVVTGMTRKKRSGQASIHADTSVAAEPVGGWNNFNIYVSRRLDSLKVTDQGNFFDKNIELEFTIDKKGYPTNIKTPAEPDKMITDKAIEILTNGPRWKNNKKDKKVKVIIAF